MLSERPVGEADRLYTICTRDLGKVVARAIAVRKINSKLRGNLEPLSLSSVSFVKGKDFWRITSAELMNTISLSAARPLSLINQLVQGEEAHPGFFDVVEKSIHSDETTFVSQILYHLGYLKESDLNLDKKSLIQAINEGIQASHL